MKKSKKFKNIFYKNAFSNTKELLQKRCFSHKFSNVTVLFSNIVIIPFIPI